MATQAATDFDKIRDPELVRWLSQESGDLREILVDAVLPGRTVTFREVSGRRRAADLATSAGTGRREALRQLRALLEPFLDTPPVILEAAGALAIRANSRQVRDLVHLPLVKSVRPNRRIHSPR